MKARDSGNRECNEESRRFQSASFFQFGSDDNTITLHIETGAVAFLRHRGVCGVLFLATADNADESQVSRGENAGRTLKHVAVLRSLIRIGTVEGTGNFRET